MKKKTPKKQGTERQVKVMVQPNHATIIKENKETPGIKNTFKLVQPIQCTWFLPA